MLEDCSHETNTNALTRLLWHEAYCCVLQAGRAGRRSQASASLYVAFDGPLDQHFMTHPHALFARPIECVQVSVVEFLEEVRQLVGTSGSVVHRTQFWLLTCLHCRLARPAHPAQPLCCTPSL